MFVPVMPSLRWADEDSLVREFYLNPATDIELLQIFARDLQAARSVNDGKLHQMVFVAIGLLYAYCFACQLAIAYRNDTIDVTRNAGIMADDNDGQSKSLV